MKYKEVCLKKGDDLLDHIYPFMVFMDSFYVSMKFHKHGYIEKDYTGHFTIEGMTVNENVRIPLYGPVKSVILNKKPDIVEFVFEEEEGERVNDDERSFTSEIIEFIFHPTFINYYESIKPKILSIMGTKQQRDWTNEVFRMGWLIRNSLSHDKKISFSDTTSSEIVWRNKIISQIHHGEPIYNHFN